MAGCPMCGAGCACSGPHETIADALIAAARSASPPNRLTPALGCEQEETTIVVDLPATVTDLLASRRALVQDLRGERDATAREVVQFQIDEIDRELVRRSV